MSLTININGLTLCHKGSNGISQNTLPDVCKTPPYSVPIPYPNVAFSKDLVQGTHSVSADGGNMIAHNQSNFASSIMDEPGSSGGIVSNVNRSKAEWISHSFDIFFEGNPACRLTDKMFMNKKNTVNMGGLLQEALNQGEKEFIELICKWAKECFIENCNRLGSKESGAKYAHYQDCLNKKIRDDAYDKNNRYPEGDIGNEVSFEKVNGKWRAVMSKNNPNFFSNRWTPKGGRRLDLTISENNELKRIIDVKFPNDGFTPDQYEAYEKIANEVGAKFEEFDVMQKCAPWPKCPNKKPEKEPVPVPIEVPVQEPKPTSQPVTNTDNLAKWLLVGGLVVVAVAVTLCPFDGPAGDVIAWGAVIAVL